MQLLISAIVQVLLFSLIPLIWWAVTARNQEGFFSWIGLKGCAFTPKMWGWMIGGTVVLGVGLGLVVWLFVPTEKLASGAFYGLGAVAIPLILIQAFIQMGLSEEIFFRGFLAKRLINKFGLTTGNTVQGIIFGLLHAAMIAALTTNPIAIVAAGIGTGIGGAIMGYVNETEGQGSILPSWLMHGTANFLAGLLSAFGFMG